MGQMVLEVEHNEHGGQGETGFVPSWVPRSVQNYIDHTEMGVPIRALARQQGCHASTILRQIRRVETLRDDPLVDGVLKTLGGGSTAQPPNVPQPARVTALQMPSPILPNASQLGEQALRVLRRLCETGAVLAVGADMEKAVIVREEGHGDNTKTAVVDRAFAEAMALQGWISAPQGGRITRYHITAAGSTALTGLMARAESRRAGVPEAEADICAIPHRIRYGLAESPLAALARRRDRDGTFFLDKEMVRAGERLREDFEIAGLGDEVGQGWPVFLTGILEGNAAAPIRSARGQQLARARAIAALQDLGPGLADIVLRCCCLLEGLETAEKFLGWSARSGKIVLRIALIRLQQGYIAQANTSGALIG